MSDKLHAHKILILDFGSQYTQLIARRVREIGVYSELHSCDMTEEEIMAFNPKGIILSGGPESVTGEGTPRAPDCVFHLGVPVLGICYGMHTMAEQLGGEVQPSSQREFGYAEVVVKAACALSHGIEDAVTEAGEQRLDVWMSHGDKVTTLPDGFAVTGASENAPIAMMSDEARKFFGIQFHPEVTHTPQGARLLERFIKDICRCDSLWTVANIAEQAVKDIQEKVGSDEVILGLSGGVDSSVTAVLLHRAIGDQLTCVFVDNGLLRKDEGDEVMAMFAKHLGIKVIRVDAEDRFLTALAGADEPEQKRKIIGKVFIDVFQEQAATMQSASWLAQGTIYPDVIESAGTKSGKSHVIKSHHNVGGLPEDMHLKLVEPLTELFKDEVRKLGLELGLPYNMLYRHPFPGPGLGVRILGEVKKEYADLLRLADAIFMEELHNADWYHKVNQAFTVFLPVKAML